MALRPPRPTRRPRAPNQSRDVAIVAIVSLLAVLFGLRATLALSGAGDWSIFWRVVALPTDILVRPLLVLPRLDQTVAQELTVAEIVAPIIVGALALFALSSLALRRR